MLRVGILIMIAMTQLGACGSTPSTGEWAGEVHDSAGVRVVHNPAIGLWRPGQGPMVQEILRIGVVEGDPEYQFGDIAGVSVDDLGRIYIGDRQAQEIRVFDPNGIYLHTIGRPGAGPGELGAGGTLALIGRGDTLIIPDPGQQRVNTFLRDGTFVRSFRISLLEGTSMQWAITPEYELIQQLRRMALPLQETEEGPDLLIRWSLDGTIIDTIMSFPAGRSLTFSGIAPSMRFFAPEPGWALTGDGHLLFAVNSEYRIEIRKLDGELIGVVERPLEPVPVTERDRQLMIDYLSEFLDRQGMPPTARDMIMQGVTFEDRYPLFARIIGGPDGEIWVRHTLTAEAAVRGEEFSLEELGSPDWDLFDRDGRYLGVITLPRRFELHLIVDDRIYGVQRDEFDVPYLVVLELSNGEEVQVDEGHGGRPG